MLEYCDRISRETARRTLRNALKPWLRQMWVIPPKASADFVYHMEDVLEVYQRPCDPLRPLICMDETSQQLLGEIRSPLPPLPGKSARFDAEYVRQGVANIFLFSEPQPRRPVRGDLPLPALPQSAEDQTHGPTPGHPSPPFLKRH